MNVYIRIFMSKIFCCLAGRHAILWNFMHVWREYRAHLTECTHRYLPWEPSLCNLNNKDIEKSPTKWVSTSPCIASQCNTLEHAVAHCNTLQHAATHGNTRQHTATHCNTLQQITHHYNTLQRNDKNVEENACLHLGWNSQNSSHETLQHTATWDTATHFNTLSVLTTLLSSDSFRGNIRLFCLILDDMTHETCFFSSFKFKFVCANPQLRGE